MLFSSVAKFLRKKKFCNRNLFLWNDIFCLICFPWKSWSPPLKKELKKNKLKRNKPIKKNSRCCMFLNFIWILGKQNHSIAHSRPLCNPVPSYPLLASSLKSMMSSREKLQSSVHLRHYFRLFTELLFSHSCLFLLL